MLYAWMGLSGCSPPPHPCPTPVVKGIGSIVRTSCGLDTEMDVVGIGTAVLDHPVRTLEISSVRLEGLTLYEGERRICVPELEPCTPREGTGQLERDDHRWTWTLRLERPVTGMKIHWVDAYR